MNPKSFILIAILILFTGCAEMLNVLQTVSPAPLTEEDVSARISPILQRVFGSRDNKA
jgi:uncharacterized lipoprotein YajG